MRNNGGAQRSQGIKSRSDCQGHAKPPEAGIKKAHHLLGMRLKNKKAPIEECAQILSGLYLDLPDRQGTEGGVLLNKSCSDNFMGI
jgi:hypothetical protein